MKTHDRFEFVIEETMESISGNSLEEIFNGLPKTIVDLGVTSRRRRNSVLRSSAFKKSYQVLKTRTHSSTLFSAYCNRIS